MNTVPEQVLAQVHQAGRISFARLMDLALYSEDGYYSKRVRIGRKGADFFTASQSPLFAMTLARAIEVQWQKWGEPVHLQVLEVGAGQGELAENIIKEIRKSNRIKRLTYRIREKSPRMLDMQYMRLQNVEQTDSLEISWRDPALDVPTIILANEVLDALPVEYLRKTEHGWEALYASTDTHEIYWHWDEADTETEDLADRYINCPEAAHAEICLSYESVMKDIMGEFTAPVQALWFDYGIFKEEWESGVRPQGTLRGYKNHELVDPFTHLFEADLTADANWSYAEAVSRQLGFTTELMSQGQFLFHHDIMKRAVELQQSEPTLLAGNRWTQQLKQLALPGGMGDRFSVLVCSRS